MYTRTSGTLVMTKDFKTTPSSSKKTTTSQYGISWVMGGIAVGLIAGAGVYALASQGKISIDNEKLALSANKTTQTINNAARDLTELAERISNPPEKVMIEDNRPSFSYHAVLPQLELNVSMPLQEDRYAPDRPPTQIRASQPTGVIAPAPPPASPQRPTEAVAPAQVASTPPPQQTTQRVAPQRQGRYMFQLGSYRSQAQAQQMQQRVAGQGLHTRIETAEIGGETWYRVRLGPTEDPQVVDRWQQMLSGMGISPMMIQL